MTNKTLENNRFSFLVNALSSQVCEIISKEKNLSAEKSIEIFYASKTFLALSDKETLLYLQGASYIYDLFLLEN